MTADNVSTKVSAVMYFHVVDARAAILKVCVSVHIVVAVVVVSLSCSCSCRVVGVVVVLSCSCSCRVVVGVVSLSCCCCCCVVGGVIFRPSLGRWSRRTHMDLGYGV